MSDVIEEYPATADLENAAAVLRSGRLVCRREGSLIVIDRNGTRSIEADWQLDAHEVTPDGEYVLGLGDDSKMAAIWEARTARRLLQFSGDPEHRQSLRAGLGVFGGDLYGFFYTRNKQVSMINAEDGTERGWMATTGMFWFHVSRILPLDAQWLAIGGYHDGEARDFALAIPALETPRDPMILYGALYEKPSVMEWGYRATVGPAGPGHAVFFRDPEWEDEEPPDDPTEAFRGIVIWDLNLMRAVRRVEYDGEVESGATIGANGNCAAVTLKNGNIDRVSLDTGKVKRVEAFALDPYRMQAARVENGTVTIFSL
jgi:hypothetical protein